MSFPGLPETAYEMLPDDESERHRWFEDVFGEYLLWTMNRTFAHTRDLVTNESARSRLGNMFRENLDTVAGFAPLVRNAALSLAWGTECSVVRRFLSLLSGQGFDNRVGHGYVLRFRLVMEICDGETGEVVDEEVVNRGGRKFFPEYWGRWLNRYGKVGLPDPPPDGEATPPQPEDGSEPTA